MHVNDLRLMQILLPIIHEGTGGYFFVRIWADFERICQLEGNGFFYQCERVPARIEDSFDEVMAETFVYLGKAEEEKRIPENDQPWRE